MHAKESPCMPCALRETCVLMYGRGLHLPIVCSVVCQEAQIMSPYRMKLVHAYNVHLLP